MFYHVLKNDYEKNKKLIKSSVFVCCACIILFMLIYFGFSINIRNMKHFMPGSILGFSSPINYFISQLSVILSFLLSLFSAFLGLRIGNCDFKKKSTNYEKTSYFIYKSYSLLFLLLVVYLPFFICSCVLTVPFDKNINSYKTAFMLSLFSYYLIMIISGIIVFCFKILFPKKLENSNVLVSLLVFFVIYVILIHYSTQLDSLFVIIICCISQFLTPFAFCYQIIYMDLLSYLVIDINRIFLYCGLISGILWLLFSFIIYIKTKEKIIKDNKKNDNYKNNIDAFDIAQY